MGMLAVDGRLGEHGEFDTKFGNKFLNFLVGLGFLFSKFVRGEGENFKALIVVFFVKGDKLLVVSFG